MAAEDKVKSNSSNRKSRSYNTEPPDRSRTPNFITDETEFVGSGYIPLDHSTPASKHRRSRSKSGSRLSTPALSLSNESFYQDLEVYVAEMSTRGSEGAGVEVDVWAQLQQKESDLLLAAELGKTLLENNEELKKERERLTEEYNRKIETWRDLKKRVRARNAQRLTTRRQTGNPDAAPDLSDMEKKVLAIIGPESSEGVGHSETGIEGEEMEELEQEKHLLRRRLDTTEGEYESRILELQNDIELLASKLDTRDSSVKQTEREKTSLIAELTAQNTRLTCQLKESSAVEAQLTSQLEALKDQCSMRKTSLQDHVQSLEALKEELALVSNKKSELEKRWHLALTDKEALAQQLDEANDRIMLLERQLREQEILYQNTLRELERLQRSHDTLAERLGGGDANEAAPRSLHTELEDGVEEKDEDWLKNEAVTVYKQLRTLVLQLNAGHDDDSGLHSDLSLTSLEVHDEPHEGACYSLRRGALLAACEDAAAAASALEGTRVRDSIAAQARRAMERERQIDEKNEIIADLSSKLSVAEVELRAAADQREQALADASCSSLQSDEAVCRARSERDEAIDRKKTLEVALARTRVELLQANGQLIEAVRQKVDLGQQLEQWQMDMQELIDEQMKRKLTSQEKKRKLPNSSAPPVAPTRASRILGFFQR